MPYKEKTEFLMYSTIGQVANHLKVATSTLRFWEKEFGTLSIRNKKGQRRYTVKNVIHLERIDRLLNTELYTIAGAKRQLELS